MPHVPELWSITDHITGQTVQSVSRHDLAQVLGDNLNTRRDYSAQETYLSVRVQPQA